MKRSSTRAAERSAPAVGPVRLADALGWGSLLLGAPMLLTPRRFLRAIGVRDHAKAVRWTVFVGVREQLALLNIIANRQRRIGMWSRAAGDSMDAVLLINAYRGKPADAQRLRLAIAGAGGFLALDLATAVALTRADRAHVQDASASDGVGVRHDTEGGPGRVRTAVTIRKPEDEVRRAFREYDWTAFDRPELEASGGLRFRRAPGDRGTELHVDAQVGGPLSGAAALVGRSPAQQVSDELRRFKSLVETGEVARSETSPEGASSARQILHKLPPAQPVGGPS
jgi:uncharacterized membrane protein